jgi:integrase
MRLTAKRVQRLLNKGVVGNHYDAHGLRLEIRSPKAASWTTRYQIDGKSRWMGLGSAFTFTLAEARERNRKLVRQLVADKRDPLAERRVARAEAAAAARRVVSFSEATASYLTDNAGKWTNAKHRAQWVSSLATYADPIIGRMPVADIAIADILRVLEQRVGAADASKFWDAKRVTASRVRGRVETILNWSIARGFRDGSNPAAWAVIGEILPGRSTRAIEHLSAMPFAEIPSFMRELGGREGVSAKALAFNILTAARTGETLGATWSEINLDTKTWVIPPGRMKAGREHTVPLSSEAAALLQSLPRERDNPYVFIGRRSGCGLARDALSNVLAGMGRRATVHGFRAGFSSWASERGFASDDIELCLAHSIGTQVERSYKRTTLIDRRRRLMRAWAAFCLRAPAAAAAAGNVVDLVR